MPKKKRADVERLVLLDAHAIIHRAYHALPDFTGPSGEPTGALYGLASMLLRIAKDLRPDYLAACYDLPKPTIRHEAYEGYKATRVKIEDALAAQLTSSRRIFEAFSIPVYEREGFEADDLLGTIAKKLVKDPHLDIVIASGDMDTLQLVDDARVRVYTLKKGLNETVTYDAAAVEERYGFPPEFIPDWKGLRGDPSDNIKGIPGVGEKTATELVTGFGHIEDMYKKLKKDESAFVKKGVKPRMIALLKEHEEDAVFSKMLATIRTDAPIAFSLPKEPWRHNVRLAAIIALFDKLGFRSLRDRARNVLSENGASIDGEEGDEALSEEAIPEEKLEEAKIMLWLLASDFTNPSLEDVLAYAKERVFDSAYDVLAKKITAASRLKEVFENIEKPLIPIIAAMEARGVRIDGKLLVEIGKRYRAELAKIEARIYKAAGREFNVSSPKQLGDILFDSLALAAKGQKKTSTGQRSTRESELEKIRDLHPIVNDVLEYREVQKLLSTYIESIPPLIDTEGRLHANFLQTGTTTGRMSSQSPNLQNIPIRTERGKAIRYAFIAPEGFSLIALDYSQIELRLAAILSGDEKLCDIFRHGRDVHREVAAMVFGVPHEKVDYEMRRRAKVINFGILYGMGVNALRAQLGTTTAEAHKFYDDYFKTFSTLAKYLERTKGAARRLGYTETLFGRRREFPSIRSPLPYVRAQAERMAINAPIQGTEGDVIKLAMVRIDEYLRGSGMRDDAHLLLQVHDELVYEVRKTSVEKLVREMKRIMESVIPEKETHGVPVRVEGKIGPNWGEMMPV